MGMECYIMKRILCLFLIIAFIFSACKESDETIISPRETDNMICAPLVDIRYDGARYEAGTMSYTLSGLAKEALFSLFSHSSFMRDGIFYGDTGSGFCMLNTEGEKIDFIAYNTEDSMQISPDTGKTVLCDGTIAVMHALDDPGIWIINNAGEILFETKLPNEQFISGMPCVLRADAYYLYVMQGNYFYQYDVSLTLLKSVWLPGDFNYEIHICKDGSVVLGMYANNLYLLDMNGNGTISQYPQVGLPDTLSDAMIRFGAEDVLYYANNDGIYTAGHDGNYPQIFSWSGGTARYNQFWYALDSTHILVYAASSMMEDSAYHLLTPASRDERDKPRRVVTLSVLDVDDNGYIAALVDGFNQTNEEYFVEVTLYDPMEMLSSYETLKESFLFGGEIPDMFCVFNGIYQRMMSDMGDKHAFVDLTPYFRDKVFQGLIDAYTVDGSLSFLPLCIQAELLAAKTSIVGTDGKLTVQKLYTLKDSLNTETGQVLFSEPDIAEELYQHSISDFVDTAQKTCSFDSEEFREWIQFLDRADTIYSNPSYGYFHNRIQRQETAYAAVSTLELSSHLQNEDVLFLKMPLSNPIQYIAVKKLFGDCAFSLCGFPSVKGGGATVTGSHFFGITEMSKTKGGAAAFMEYILSQEMQIQEKLICNALPVTRKAMEAVLKQYHYYYPVDDNAFPLYTEWDSTLEQSVVLGTHIEPFYRLLTSPDALFLKQHPDFYEQFYEISMTETDISEILSFFDRCSMYGGISEDAKITAILEEELSAYENGVKTLDEVSLLIQSRVWIYLNE